MDELIKQLRDGYIEDIRRAVPLSRAVLAIYFWILISAIKGAGAQGPISILMDISIADYFELDNGLLWKTSPFELILVFVGVVISVWAYRILSVAMFDMLTKIRDPKIAFGEMIKNAKTVVSSSNDENEKSIKTINQLFEVRSRILSFRIKLGETIFGIGLGVVLLANYWVRNDVILLVVCVILFFSIQLNVYRYYLSMAAPIIIQKLVLTGQLPKFGDGVFSDVNQID